LLTASAHVSQHRQAREILDVPEGFTLDQYASMLGAEAEQANELVEVRQVLEAMLGRTSDSARSTNQLAREVVAQAERWRIDAEHCRGEACNATRDKARRVDRADTLVAQHEEMYAALRKEADEARAKCTYLQENLDARNTIALATKHGENITAIAALKLEDGASQSDIIETIKSLLVDQAKLADMIMGDKRSVETEAERQVRRCAEALGYIGEPNTLAIAVGDACLAFAKDLRRNMITVKRLEGEIEARNTAIEKWKAGSEWLQGELNDLVHERNEAHAEAAKSKAQAESSDLQQRELSRQFMEYSQLVDGYKLAMVKLGSATQITDALGTMYVARDVLRSTFGAVSLSSLKVPTAAVHLLDSLASVYGDRDAISLVELIDAAFAFGICASRHPEFREIRCPAEDSEVPVTATTLRHELTAKLRAAARTASAWEEAAVREWAPLAPDYHGGDGTVTKEIEGPYIEHRLVMAWRGQIQQMADNLDPSEKAGQ